MAILFNQEITTNYIHFERSAVWTKTYGSDITYDYFADASGVNDAIYFNSYFKKYRGLKFNITTPLAATSIAVAWEYYTSAGWVALAGVIDGTNAFQASGVQSVSWTMPINWYNCPTIGGQSTMRGYNVRCRITAVSGITEGGAQTGASTKYYSNAIHLNAAHRMSEILAADVAGGWGVVTRDASEKNYLFDCNVMVDSGGEFIIRDHEVVTIGKSPGWHVNHAAFEVGTSGTLTIGQKNAVSGFGYNGATLIWNNGHNQGSYLYWRGNVNMYQSKFWFYGGGYTSLSFGCVLDIVDCLWGSGNVNHTWYLTASSSGSFVRTLIAGYYLYVYSGDLSFEDTNLTKEEDGGNPYGALAGYGNYFAKITGMDFQDFIRCTVTQHASMALIDCASFQDSQATRSGNYTTPEHIHRRFNLFVKVVDVGGNAIEDAEVKLLDTDGRSGLFEDMRMMTGLGSLYVTDLDTPTDTTARTNTGGTANFSAGDIIRIRGEIIEIYSIVSSTTMTVVRNLAGTTCNGHLTRSHAPYMRRESVLTNSDGELYYDTDVNFQVTVKDFPRHNNVDLAIKDFNPFTLSVAKAGYQTVKIPITIDKKVDEVVALKRIEVNVDNEAIA